MNQWQNISVESSKTNCALPEVLFLGVKTRPKGLCAPVPEGCMGHEVRLDPAPCGLGF